MQGKKILYNTANKVKQIFRGSVPVMMMQEFVPQYGNLSVDMMARHIPMNVLQIMTMIAR